MFDLIHSSYLWGFFLFDCPPASLFLNFLFEHNYFYFYKLKTLLLSSLFFSFLFFFFSFLLFPL